MTRRQHLEAGRRAIGREIGLPDRSSQLLAKRLVSAVPAPSQETHRRELIERVRQALARLTDADREMLLMRDFEELSYQEVGYILAIDPAAARKRYGRALLRLHKLLSDSGMTGSEL
jgi:RNA polymerase sigma-70 factor (ECF subfamily)